MDTAPEAAGFSAKRLDRISALSVHEAQGGEPLHAGEAYVAPGGCHMIVARGKAGILETRLDFGPPENECKPAVDPLFRSAAAVCGGDVRAAVLTGMGKPRPQQQERCHQNRPA